MNFDTDVLVWFCRKNANVLTAIQDAERRCLSIVSYMELMQGARNVEEMENIRRLLAECDFEILALSENIGHRASIYIEEYALKSGLRVADALIAATSADLDVVLCTANRKHFRAIQEVKVKPFHP